MSRRRADAPAMHPRHERRGEARAPAVVATLAAITLYLALPQQLLVAPRYVLPALEVLLLLPLIASFSTPRSRTGAPCWSRRFRSG
ncbi:hypothetical protein [Streptomyces sp. NPDC001194]|uniref:hypothetical protein n=1 Tax=Streptomyces sp. NPDC001194 TaxID=3364547 RepID=UPI0036A42081